MYSTIVNWKSFTSYARVMRAYVSNSVSMHLNQDIIGGFRIYVYLTCVSFCDKNLLIFTPPRHSSSSFLLSLHISFHFLTFLFQLMPVSRLQNSFRYCFGMYVKSSVEFFFIYLRLFKERSLLLNFGISSSSPS